MPLGFPFTPRPHVSKYYIIHFFFLSSDIFLDALCSLSFYRIRELMEEPYLAHASLILIPRESSGSNS